VNFLANFWDNLFSAICASLMSVCAADAGLPEHLFSIDRSWPESEQHAPFGQATGVGVDSLNRVFVFHRAGREWRKPVPTETISADTVYVLDGDRGTLLDSWGSGLFTMPHGLSVDTDNNIWVTDVGSHQVHKFTPDGKLLLTLGQSGEQGSDEFHFAQPTDVAFDDDGGVYVSDGYLNTRVVKFSKDGNFLFQWGTGGDGPGQFDLPHGIATDKLGRVYVADRSNSRIQVFSIDGEFMEEWKRPHVGRPYGVDVSPSGDVFVIDGGDQPFWTKTRVRKLDGEGTLTGLVDLVFDDATPVLGHDIAIGPDGAIYVVDAWANKVQKLLPN